MARLSPIRVAVLGARFGELNIETEILSPLGVELVEGSGKGEAETLSICKDVEVIRVLEGKVPKNLVNPGVIRYIGSRKTPII